MCCKEGSDYYYFHYNLKGDVVSITDADKEEVAYYEYDAWGNTMTEAGTWSSPYRFSTKEWDYDSSLYYFGARYCDPEVARGTRRYPMGIVDRLNLYSYAVNEPANCVDPLSLSSQGLFDPPVPGCRRAGATFAFKEGGLA